MIGVPGTVGVARHQGGLGQVLVIELLEPPDARHRRGEQEGLVGVEQHSHQPHPHDRGRNYDLVVLSGSQHQSSRQLFERGMQGGHARRRACVSAPKLSTRCAKTGKRPAARKPRCTSNHPGMPEKISEAETWEKVRMLPEKLFRRKSRTLASAFCRMGTEACAPDLVVCRGNRLF